MNYYFVVYGLSIISVLITLLAQLFIDTSYRKYSKVKNERGITGLEAARYILDKNNLEDINITKVNGYLSDHYDPRNKVIRLSNNVYSNSSVGAVAVACHECGHAIQDKENYVFMRIRSKLVPIVNFSSYAGYVAILLGCLFGALELIWLGIFLEIAILIFQLITLPVEIDASKRALKELDYAHLLSSKELKQAKVMLTAAALTYVASLATTLIQILRLILMFTNRNDR